MSEIHDFISNATERFYNVPTQNLKERTEGALVDFIHNPRAYLLQACLSDEKQIRFFTEIQASVNKSIIFYKTKALELTAADALNNINMITLTTGAAASLYQVLRLIYSPMLAIGDDLFSGKLQKNLLELESNLRVITHGEGSENVKVILCVEDEVEYWKAFGDKRDAKKAEKEAASAFSVLFEDICEEIRALESTSMQEVKESAENIAGILDDVWRYTPLPYSQERMVHIFDIVGHSICSVTRRAVSEAGVWAARGPRAAAVPADASGAVRAWTNACTALTHTYWPNYALHEWKGKPYVPEFCNRFQKRLEEIQDIRGTYDQLDKLLTKSERAELNSDRLLEPFRNINVWICNGPDRTWENAVSKFSADIRPAETKIAEKLKPRLQNMSPKQSLYEFQRYRTLVSRPGVRNVLARELQLLVSSLLELLRATELELRGGQGDQGEGRGQQWGDQATFRPPEMTALVAKVQWARHMEDKVKEIETCVENYLKDFEQSTEVLQLASKLQKDLKAMYTQLYEDWSRNIQAQLKDGSLQLSDRPVVEFSTTDRLMVVNFPPGLVRAEGEARALCAAGLAPPAAAALQRLTAPLAYARALNQVASFHNTLAERAVCSTRPLLLRNALALAALVGEQRAPCWDDEPQLERYTRRLKDEVLALEKQNNYLTDRHLRIRNIVEKLMDTELLAKLPEWKKGIKDIRDIIEKVEADGFTNTELWRSHWDLQLYKAMECQYIQALLSLHTHFPSVRVDLVLRGGAVRVQPAEEELRARLYALLRRLVTLPATLQGLGPTGGVPSFADIVDKHGWLGNGAVSQLEKALGGVERACVRWTRRAALGCVPVRELCAALTAPEDWDLNFKACKAYGQEVAKMAFDDEKIEWITVGTVTLRRDFEAQARNLWAGLMTSLTTSCRDDAAELEAFMANATVILEDKTIPKNTRELTEISAKRQTLQEKMPEMEKKVEDLKRKSHMLRTWGGDSSLDNTTRGWDKLRELVTAHQMMFEHQAEQVKSSLTGECENLRAAMETWMARVLPRINVCDMSYDELVTVCEDVFRALDSWETLADECDDLMSECKKFNMNSDMSETREEAYKIYTERSSLWSPFKEYNEEYQSLARQEWIVFQKKLHLLDDFVAKWTRLLEPYTTITLCIKRELDQYSELTAVLKYLRGPELTEQHWLRVEEVVGLRREAPGPPLLGVLLRSAEDLKKNMKLLQKISSSASSEAAIRSALSELELWYAGARVSLRYHAGGDTKHTPVATDYKEVLAKVEEQQWVVSSLDGGEASAVWEARLRTARTLLAAAQQAQRRWLYLEPILNNDDGDLGIKFRKVDHLFKQVARIIEADPRLSTLVQSTRLQPMLDAISEQLNACQSALNQYIDDKRSIFPRLYFLSDDDLLELLGQARAGAEGREVVMQSHLKKLFPGLTGVTLGPGDLSVTALCSQYGEIFTLEQPVPIDCSVEVWLNNLEQEIRSSLKNLTLKCLVANNLPDQDPFSLPTQILCLLQNIRFTEQTEKAIRSKELRRLIDNIEKENIYYAAADIEDESEKYKRQALILQCAYYISVVQSLIENSIVATSDWLWQKQLRFYVKNKHEVVAKMGLAEISYSYEYLGVCTGQFVRTETTDESFLILTQALHLGFVGNPFGPAGTGKTESVKALGSLLGRLVLVFNCDEAMDAPCLARLLSGVARCGAWGCFDEFNRLERPALAAAAHQLTALLAALVAGEKDVVLHGRRVSLSPWCGVAVTLNPAGRGYGGRRTLPAALQAALRPLALRPPSSALLAARLLAALAPCDAPDIYRRLGNDLEAVFQLASTLLSGERHYDWGLRALKAAVGSCGAALSAGGAKSLEVCRAVLRRVLRLNNLSKLTLYDAERFENILSMVFADVPEEQTEVNPIYSALENSVNHLGLVRNDVQIQKCVELYEQLQQRMGVVIVGPPGSGKTTIRHMLKTALQQQGRTVVQYVIHPKAMLRECLLGAGGARGGGGGPGVLGGAALQAAAQTDSVWSWIVCDGDVDPDWVEALNSVLDDNRVLTLPAGERVQLGHDVGFVFETHSVQHASPATMSRLGVILLSEESDCSEEVLERWVRNADFENETVRLSIPVLQEAVKKCLRWMKCHSSDIIMKHCHVSLTRQIIAQFEYILQEPSSETIGISGEEAVYSAIRRSVTGLLKESAIENCYRELQIFSTPSPSAVVRGARLRAAECVLRAALQHEHCLVLGPRACAKNILAEGVLRETFSTVVIIDCTPILEPSHIIAELKRRNVVCGADGGGGGRRGSTVRKTGGAGLLVRALHRAARDSWGSCRVHDFLMELIQEGGFWSVEEGGPQWHSTGRISVVATADIVAQLSQRLSASLLPVVLSEPDDDELLELSEDYLKNSVTKNIPDNDIASLVRNMLLLYKEVCQTFDSQPHYTWTCSHLRQWCENIKYYSPTTATEVLVAIKAEAAMIFRERLITVEEKIQYNIIAQKHLKVDDSEVFYKPKLKSDGVYLERVNQQEWYHYTQKLINQCLTDGTEGAAGVEACDEQRAWGAVAAGALNGAVATCVSAAGCGRRAAAALLCSALGAALHTALHRRHFYTVCKNAITSASEGTRTLLVLGEAVSSGTWLGCVEALLKADSLHALPTDMVPSLGQAQTQTFSNIKQNLGIMICLDKDQENINALLEQYPLLHGTSRMCWLDHWSLDTLRQMPTLVVQRLMKENVNEMSQEDLNALPIEGFIGIYQSLDAAWLRAPSRYLHFIRAYHHILGTKRGALIQRRNMLAAGVEALERARSAVAVLQDAATKQEEALGVERAAAATALQQLGGTVRAATERKEEMQVLKKNIEEENEKLQIKKKEIEAGLAAVEPVVAAARAAVGDIRTESLSEVRSLRAPPEVVRDVLEGVLRLMGIADTSWHSMKNFLSKRGVKEDIKCLDARSISPAAAAAVERLVERRASSFSAESARRASAAVAPLAAWVHANLEHAKALARVRPLQERQRELHEELRRAEAELGSLSSGLVAADERVSELQTRLGRHERDAAALEHELARAGDTLRTARDLLERLAGEAASWETDLDNISREILELNQRSLLAAGYMIYLPHLTESQARDYLAKWGALIGFEDERFSVINFLSSAEEQLQWQAEGLPSDRSAAKNAVVLHQCLCPAGGCGSTPVLLDPEGAALRWVRSSLPGHRLVSARADGLLPALHYATRLGGILVITDVEDIEDWWWSASSGCRIIIISRDTSLLDRLLPHIRAEITPLYFTARLDTLLDQLVNYVMENQHPEIYEKCKEIIITKAKLQKQQHELQENLLRDLSRDSDILHDAGLLASLKKTRAAGAAAGVALAEAHAAEEEARARGAGYRACAVAPARLALAARKLASRRPLVALPARAVRDVFLAAVRRASSDPKNINNDEITKYSVRKIIERVLLSVHKKDKYTVALHLLKEAHEDFLPDKLWQLLLGNFKLEIEDKNLIADLQKKFNWISEDCVRRLAQIKIQDKDLFGRLSLERSDLWLEFQRSGSPNALPALAPHERALAAAAVHPPALHALVGAWLRQELGSACVQGGDALSAAAAAGGRASLLLAPQVTALSAAAARASCKLLVVGVDEGLKAWEERLESARGGTWLAIAVGASPFPQELILFVEAVTERPASDFSNEFRLWIVAEEREIPSALTNACVTVILEPPEGVKRNACSTLSSWTSDRDADATRLLAGAALLHAVVQERRAYIPIGWSRWYGWEWGDVRAAHAAVCATEGAGARELCCALYAARVSARADRVVLGALAPRCLSGTLPARVQPRASLQDYITAFESLPDADEPALLALPANCRAARDLRAARRLLAGLAELSTTAPIKKGDTVTPLKTLRSLFKKSMSGSPLLRSDYRVENAAGWWGAVCAGEARDAARASVGLKAGLRTGIGAPRETPLARVPDEWQLLWSGPDAPDEYIEEFCHRARAAVGRISGQEINEDYMPKEVDLRSFLRPERVLSALLARRAARTGCSPAALSLQARWDCTTVGDDDAICVRGLCLSGGVWRRAGGGGKSAAGTGGALEATGVDSPPLAEAPPLLLRYVVQDTGATTLDTNQALLPLYESVRREKELCVVRAPLSASLSPRDAALHAVALLVAPLR